MQDTQQPMNDMGNSSGVSVARNTVFATSQGDSGSTLFALKLGATGDSGGDDGGGGGEDEPPSDEEPPDDGGGSSSGTIATGPGAQNYGYLTPTVTINQGESVDYLNADAIRHNVSSTDGLFRSDFADGGKSVPVAGVEKLKPGTYDFLCEPHPNMKGKLTVR
jgi:plastocyanin